MDGQRPPSGDVAELLCLRERLQLLERLVLDLSNPLAGDVERAADLVERARVLSAKPVAQLEHAAFAVGEVLEGLPQRLLGEDLGCALVGGLSALVGEELAELGLLLVAHRLLERHGRLRGALDRIDLFRVDAGYLGDLIGGWLAAKLGDQLALGATDLVELLDDVHRDTDRASLVRERPGDRLTDPPRRIGGELEALAVVELLGRAYEPEGPLLDQVEERQPLIAVVLGDRHDESQVRLDHLLLRVEVAALDPLGEIDLLLSRQQAHLADVLQEQLQRVGGHVRLQIERSFGFAPTAFVGSSLNLRGGGDCWIYVLDELDLRALEKSMKLFYVRLVEVELAHRLGYLRIGEDAHLLPLGQ